MNEYTKSLLRAQILEHRTELRKARQVLKEKTQAANDALSTYKMWADRIADLQRSIGDPVEVDPTYPDERT